MGLRDASLKEKSFKKHNMWYTFLERLLTENSLTKRNVWCILLGRPCKEMWHAGSEIAGLAWEAS